MIKLEAERKKNAPPSVLELEKRRENQKILKNGAPPPLLRHRSHDPPSGL